jgi:hypothetical protein
MELFAECEGRQYSVLGHSGGKFELSLSGAEQLVASMS